jgi:hypothetical protein
MSKYHLLEDAANSPQENMELDEGGVWREVLLIDEAGKVTRNKHAAVTTTLIVPPDESHIWDNETQTWVCPEIERRAPVQVGHLKVHKKAIGETVAYPTNVDGSIQDVLVIRI